MRVPIYVLMLALLAASLPGCGSSRKLNSKWADRDIEIDGEQKEWNGAIALVEEKNVAIGLFNDRDYLYVSLSSNDRQVMMQFMTRGLNLWFDPDGGRDKRFGIRFPLGMMELGMTMRGHRGERNPEDMKKHFRESLVSLELTSPDEKEPVLLTVEEAKGIEVRVGDLAESLFYEVKVPLRKDDNHPYAIGVETGKPVGVGFETPDFERDQMRRPMNGGGMGRPGGMEGPEQPGGLPGDFGGRGGMRPQGSRPEPLKIWTRVTLSTPAANQPQPEAAAPQTPSE